MIDSQPRSLDLVAAANYMAIHNYWTL